MFVQQLFCSAKALIITYFECVFLALVTQHVMGMHHIVMCSPSDYCIIPHYLVNGTVFRTKVTEHKSVF